MVRNFPEGFPKPVESHFLRKYSSGYWTSTMLWLGQELPEDVTQRTEESITRGNLEVLYSLSIEEKDALPLLKILGQLVRREHSLLSAFLYNAFLSEENKEQKFRDFLDENFSRVLDDVQNHRFPYHKDTNRIFLSHEIRDFVLIYKAQGQSSTRRLLERLTQEQVRTIFHAKSGFPTAKPSTAARVIESILEREGGKPNENPQIDHVRNLFCKAYAKAVLAMDEASGPPLYRLAGSAAHVCYYSSRSMFHDPLKEKVGQISSSEAMTYAQFLYENAEKFGPKKLIILIHLLSEPTLFAVGHKRELRHVLLSMTKKDNAVELLSAVVELALFCTKGLPTAKEWVNALGGEELEIFGSGELLAELVITNPKETGGTRDAQRKLKSLIGLS